jgi:TolA-binding protein
MQKAIALWGRVQKDYPSYSKAPMALFLQGFVSDSELRDVVSATRYYRDFIVKYPNDPLADQALKLVKVITRSPDELVKEFEAQQGSGVAE